MPMQLEGIVQKVHHPFVDNLMETIKDPQDVPNMQPNMAGIGQCGT
jgi:hypothetical protein